MTLHTDFRKGQKVRIMWKNKAPHLIAHFIESGRNFILIEFRDNGMRAKIKLKEIRSINIERGVTK